MSGELFKKIIDELSETKFSGRLSLFSNNEPFLDERIIDFHKYASEKCENAFIWLYTNGTLLTFDKFMEILPYLDRFTIDNYNDDKTINSPELKKIYDYLQRNPEMKARVDFSFRLQNEVLTSRGGQAPNKQDAPKNKYADLLCFLPFRQIIIRPTGKISLCCNDALGKYTLGDVNKQTLDEIWHSEEHERIRDEMIKHGRKNLMLCKDCDTLPGVNVRLKHVRGSEIPRA